jgi:hypothetical protein
MTKLALSARVALLALAPLTALTAEPALASGFGEESALPLIDHLVRWIGYSDVNKDWRDLFAFSLFIYALAFGYASNLALHDHGFGKVINGLVGVAGVCVALHLVGERLTTLGFNLLLIIAGTGSAVSLIGGALAKGVLSRFMQRHLDRLDKPAAPRPMVVETPLDPRIASALRDKP